MAIISWPDGLTTVESGDTFTLPVGKFGHTYRVKNISEAGLATILPDGSETIDGDSSMVVAPAATVMVVWNGYMWAVLSIPSSKIFITREGGIAVRLTNRTGSATVKGYMVKESGAYPSAVELAVIDDPNPVGVMYENGIANGSECLVVVTGIADVYFVDSTSKGYIARGFLSSDSGYVPGQCMCEVAPSPPFAAEKHYYEIGIVQESRTGPGLAKCLLRN